MSGSIQIESLLVAKQPKGMDLDKGVPSSKDGEDFADILNTEVEAADTVVKTEPTDGVGPESRPVEEEGAPEVDVAQAALASGVSVPHLVAQLVREELTSVPKEQDAALMIDKVKVPTGVDIGMMEGQNKAEITQTPAQAVASAVKTDAKTSAQIVMPQIKAAEPVELKNQIEISSDEEAPVSTDRPQDFLEIADVGEDTSKPMDLRSFSESLFVQTNLLKGEGKTFEGEVQKLQAADASHLKPQIMREVEPLMTRVSLSNTGGEMTIQLKPHHMGMVKVDVQVEGELVKVNFQAENPATRSALQSQVQDLKQSMNMIGLKVDQVQVGSLMTQENTRNDSQQQHQQHTQQHNHQGGRQQSQQQAAQEHFEYELMEMSA